MFDAALLLGSRASGGIATWKWVCAPDEDDWLAPFIRCCWRTTTALTGFAGVPIMLARLALAVADVFGPYRIDGFLW